MKVPWLDYKHSLGGKEGCLGIYQAYEHHPFLLTQMEAQALDSLDMRLSHWGLKLVSWHTQYSVLSIDFLSFLFLSLQRKYFQDISYLTFLNHSFNHKLKPVLSRLLHFSILGFSVVPSGLEFTAKNDLEFLSFRVQLPRGY